MQLFGINSEILREVWLCSKPLFLQMIDPPLLAPSLHPLAAGAHCKRIVVFSYGLSQKTFNVIIAMRGLPERLGQSVSRAPGSAYPMISTQLEFF